MPLQMFRFGSGAIILAGLLGSGMAWGQQPVESAVGQKAAPHTTSAVWIDQKATMIDRFLGQSQTMQRIAEQGSAEIKAKVERIRSMRSAAGGASIAGDMAKAASLLDQALKEVMEVSRLSADPASQQWLHRARYEDLQEGIDHFGKVYQSHLEQRRKSGDNIKPGYDPKQIQELTIQAKALAGEQKYEEANRHLNQAHGIIVASLKTLLGSRTLVYDLKFESPAQEFQYERERSNGLESLLRLVLSQNEVGDGERKQVQQLAENSMNLRQQSERQAASGDHAGAVKTMEQSNNMLGQALRAAGVNMPL